MAELQTELGGQQSVTRQSEEGGANTNTALRARKKRGSPAEPKLRRGTGSREGRRRDYNMQTVGPHTDGQKQKSSTGMENRMSKLGEEKITEVKLRQLVPQL